MFSVMGNCISCWKRHREPHKEITLLLVGIDNAGKTVAAKGLLGESIEGVAPTVGFSSSSMRYDKFDVTLHDLGGGKKIRAIWKNYLSEAYGLIYVVDSSDGERMQESKAVLKDLLQNPRISGKPVLVLANKQDVPGALDEIDVVDQLDLELLVNTYKCPCRVETCSASLGQGKKMDAALRAGFRWLLETIGANFDLLHKRVEHETALQREAEEQDKRERIARVKKAQEERAKAEGQNEEDCCS
ncbi:PREDICTED: ADP-ribosylation factor-like protein 13B [Priapulus caudatus]|uniref:ADP-ribosylation factor-like protein 13B n=1 Tax=Priapulus caudatus TaxID=37621 RepID=A0ABM1ELJ5_PRICU|nr:PREDICTED: ADP-ribosylation factor-like protein 13B [Priapulus caudatus]